MVLTLMGAVGFLAATAIVVPLLAYGLSALLDPSNRRRNDGDEGRGGVLAPRQPGPSGPPDPMTKSAEPGDEEGTVS